MKAFVVYVPGDYVCAIAITTDENSAKHYSENFKKRTGIASWYEEIDIGKKIVELNCD